MLDGGNARPGFKEGWERIHQLEFAPEQALAGKDRHARLNTRQQQLAVSFCVQDVNRHLMDVGGRQRAERKCSRGGAGVELLLQKRDLLGGKSSQVRQQVLRKGRVILLPLADVAIGDIRHGLLRANVSQPGGNTRVHRGALRVAGKEIRVGQRGVEERLVFAVINVRDGDWTANRKTGFVAPEFRPDRTRPVQEKLVAVEFLVLQKVRNAAVKAVVAHPGTDLQVGTAVASGPGRIECGLHVHHLNRIQRHIDVIAQAAAAVHHVRGVHAIDHQRIIGWARPVDRRVQRLRAVVPLAAGRGRQIHTFAGAIGQRSRNARFGNDQVGEVA